MVIDITPIPAVVANLIVFLLGIDFLWNGYWYLRTHKNKLSLGIFGYLGLRLFERANNNRKPSAKILRSIYQRMFNMESAGAYLVIVGFALVLQGLIPLLVQLFR